MKIQIILIAIFCIGISACKKNSSSDTKAKTNTDYLTQKSWILIADRTNVDNGSYTDVFSTTSSCQKDNIVTFNANGTYTNDEGASKCSVSAPQTITGSWSFTTNETKIAITPNGSSSQTATILQLDNNMFKIVVESIVSSHTYRDEGTYSHP